MSVATAITRLGFKRWYERELISGHGHLVLMLLSLLGGLGAVEADVSQDGGHRALMALCLATATAVGRWSIRRYIHHLARAEALADQAACPHCGSYARWAVEGEAGSEASPLTVRCRACDGRWQIHC